VEAPAEPRRRFSRALLFVAVVGWLLILAPVIALVWQFAIAIPRYRQALQARHQEALPLIQFANNHFKNFGRWPQRDEIAANPGLCPPDWEYEFERDAETPVVWLHGRYHMSIYYRFPQPNAAQSKDVWTLSFEGSKSQFNAQPQNASP
jgi:hypothetical protein